jgi:outer membrane protein assembly factor BamB
MGSESPRRPPRWWPLIVILGLMVAGIITINLIETRDHQQANVLCMLISVASALLVFLWLTGFSRLPARRRFLSALAYLGGLGLVFAGFRVDGFTGNLLPIFVWRWSDAPRLIDSPRVTPATPTRPVAGLADFPQFFGPERNGKLLGPKLQQDWATHPPELLWRRPVGSAWTGFVVAGRRAITQEQRDADEAVVCRDVVTGDVLWIRLDRARFENPVAGIGPRATPTVLGDRVFTQGSTGVLNCLELATGSVVWSKNILTDAGAELPEWGVAGSPLVVGDVVVVNPGGPGGKSIVAYDRRTGEVAWHGGDDRAHWSSPVRGQLAGREQILVFGAAGVSGYDAGGGEVLWSHPWRGGHPHIAMPVICPGDRVLISSGYGTGAQLLRVAASGGKFSVRTEWKRPSLKAKFANYLIRDGLVYGLDDGVLTCVDLSTGRRKWKGGRYGHGQILCVDDLLLVTTEHGEIVLVEAVPDEHRELARFVVFDRKTWNPPALAGRFLLVRNDREAACFRLPVVQ